MGKLPALKPKVVLKVLMRVGFYIHCQKGSHAQLRHPVHTQLRITIPMHSNFDLPPQIVHSILKQAGLSRDEFLRWL
ncbi:MAG: type II toxin-antitoxin system HicA family toxin [Patescibacteria group bacterium]